MTREQLACGGEKDIEVEVANTPGGITANQQGGQARHWDLMKA